MKKILKIPFSKWKEKSRKIDPHTVHVSMNGETETVTVKSLKSKK